MNNNKSVKHNKKNKTFRRKNGIHGKTLKNIDQNVYFGGGGGDKDNITSSQIGEVSTALPIESPTNSSNIGSLIGSKTDTENITNSDDNSPKIESKTDTENITNSDDNFPKIESKTDTENITNSDGISPKTESEPIPYNDSSLIESEKTNETQQIPSNDISLTESENPNETQQSLSDGSSQIESETDTENITNPETVEEIQPPSDEIQSNEGHVISVPNIQHNDNMTLAALKTLADFFTKNTVDQIKILIKPHESSPESSMVYAANAMTSNSQINNKINEKTDKIEISNNDKMTTSNNDNIATSNYYNKPEQEYNNAAPQINDIHDLANKIAYKSKAKLLDHLTKHGILDKNYGDKLINIKNMADITSIANQHLDKHLNKGIDTALKHTLKHAFNQSR